MRYVDGYVLKIKQNDLEDYKTIASEAGKIWMKHGALSYVETTSDDLASVKDWGGRSFADLANAEAGDLVIFSFITFESKEHRDEVNGKVHVEMEQKKEEFEKMSMPFNLEEMAYGGFTSIVDLQNKDEA